MKEPLACRHAKPPPRYMSNNGGGRHGRYQRTGSEGHTHRVPRGGCPGDFGSRSEDKPEHRYIQGPEQPIREPKPDILKKKVQGICFRWRFGAHGVPLPKHKHIDKPVCGWRIYPRGPRTAAHIPKLVFRYAYSAASNCSKAASDHAWLERFHTSPWSARKFGKFDRQ